MAATVARTPVNQYSTGVSGGTVPTDLFIRDVPDWTKMQLRQDRVFLGLIGRGSAPDMPMHKREWGWGSPDPHADALDGAIGSTSATTITVDNGAYFQVDDRILVNDEEMLVTGVSGDNLTVVRGYGDTSAATHSNDDAVYILGPAVSENADDPASPFTQGEVDFNYHQIMSFTWQYSARAQVTKTYESKNYPGNRDAQELRKKQEFTAPLRLELTLLLGQRNQGTGSEASAMGGLRQSSYITTREDASSAPLTENLLMEHLQTVHNLVGPSAQGKTIMCSPFFARVISSWYNDTRRSGTTDTKMNLRWTEIDTWFGTFKVVPNYLMAEVANDRIYVFNEDDFKLTPYASGFGWTTGNLPTQGWYKRGFLRADFTLVAEMCDTRLEIYNLSTTAGHYPGLA